MDFLDFKNIYARNRMMLVIDGSYSFNIARTRKLSIPYKDFLHLFKSNFKMIFSDYYCLVNNKNTTNVRSLIEHLSFSGYTVEVREHSDNQFRNGSEVFDVDIILNTFTHIIDCGGTIEHVVFITRSIGLEKLMLRLRSRGITVSIIGIPNREEFSVPSDLVKCADNFIDITEILNSLIDVEVSDGAWVSTTDA